MKVRTVSILAVAFAAVSIVPVVLAQRTPVTVVTRPPQRTATPVPSSIILPMTNPVAPMSNPVAPIIPPPSVRSGGTRPNDAIPEQSRGNRGGDRPGNNGQGQRGRGRDVVAVPVPTYYYPPYSYYPELYPELERTPATIPGQLPGVRYDQYATGPSPSPDAPPAAAPASVFIYVPQAEVYTEPRLIINEPRPDRVVQPPAIGASRADVIALLGQPWGTITARGQETLYFDGLVVVLGADGRVSQVR